MFSHVDLYGNEMMEKVAKDVCGLLTNFLFLRPHLSAIILSEKITKYCGGIGALIHHWYLDSKPDSAVTLEYDKDSRIALLRIVSGHKLSVSLSERYEIFATFTKCQDYQASAEHTLGCLGHSREDIYSNPFLLLDILRVFETLSHFVTLGKKSNNNNKTAL